MSHHFFMADLGGSLLAFTLFVLFAFVPGYVAGWTIRLLDFSKRTPLAQAAVAIPLSIGVAPGLAYLLARFVSMAAVWVVFGVMWVAFPVIVIRTFSAFRRRLPPRKALSVYTVIACGWVAAGLISLVDVQIRNRLYFSVVSFDYTLRTALVSSISRTGIPPANPYFYPGHAVTLRYHYFWLIPCSLVDLLGGSLVSPRQAIIGGTLWCGLGLMAIVAVYLRFVHPDGPRAIQRRSLLGIGLLAVTGLDLIPNLLLDFAKSPLPDAEWWNNQVSSWTTSVLWVPHHTAALIAGLAAVLILWHAPKAPGVLVRTAQMAAAGLCLATCAGSSIYVGFVFGAALLAWTCVVLLKRWYAEALLLAGAGLIALAAAARHLMDLHGSMAGAPGTGPVLVFRVRDFTFTGLLGAWTHGAPFRVNLANALLLPVNYFFELGAFFAGGIWTLRRWMRGGALNRYQLATLALAGSSLLICTFLRSSVIANNDLGCRGFLLAQFVLLLWTVDLLKPDASLRPAQRTGLILLLAIGAAGSIYEAAVLRAYPMLSDALNLPRYAWLSSDHNLGRRTYALRAGYEEINHRLPPEDIVQHNPDAVPGDLPYGLYADRPVAAEGPECGVVFGGDPASCAAIQARLKPIFDGAATGDAVDQACAALDISAVLVKDTDPAWKGRNDWVWQREPITANRFMRALPCGGRERTPAENAAGRLPPSGPPTNWK